MVIGHAYNCQSCRARLLADPARTLAGQRLGAQEREKIAKLNSDSFGSLNTLAAAIGSTTAELYAIMDEPRCRLRHL
ncbi:MAG: hypothetical protein IT330_10395 [Anaerolineae bacterium]|nr:hypothetical protein [Anaerolineae bacterium]